GVAVSRRIDEVVIHHTWRPTAAQYRGIETVRAVRRYHVDVRGWSDNGYHVMIGPDGAIFLCRPLERAGAHVAGRNAHTVGVAYIANFDSDEPASCRGLRAGYEVVAALLDRFGLPTRAIRFHREFAPKTCPGLKLGLAAFRQAVAEVGARGAGMGPVVVLLPEDRVVECQARVEEGVTRVDLRPLAEALGWQVQAHINDQGKVYLRR
ncbi:MAG: peptidoglycan recognition family protein, partial [Armatimonadota bacterium]